MAEESLNQLARNLLLIFLRQRIALGVQRGNASCVLEAINCQLTSSSSSKRLYYFIQIIALKHKAEGTGTAENKTVSAIRGELTDDTQNLKRS